MQKHTLAQHIEAVYRVMGLLELDSQMGLPDMKAARFIVGYERWKDNLPPPSTKKTSWCSPQLQITVDNPYRNVIHLEYEI